MKTLITFLFFSLSMSLWSQTHLIVKHNGEKLHVNYIKTDNNLIYFNSGKDQMEQTISTFAVAELINNSTNVATKVSDKIIVNGVQDYNKVKVIPANQQHGLMPSPQKITYQNRVKGQTPLAVQQQNLTLLKRKAAKEGIPFISLVSENRNESSATLLTY